MHNVYYFLFLNFGAMKNLTFLVLAVLCSLFLWCCKNSAEKNKLNATELISIKTMGLAYLEEFKLEEAEKEFRL